MRRDETPAQDHRHFATALRLETVAPGGAVSDSGNMGNMPNILLRAIISGFGYKIGAELGRVVAEKVGLKKPDKKNSEAAEESDMPAGLPKDPPDEPDESEPGSEAGAEQAETDERAA